VTNQLKETAKLAFDLVLTPAWKVWLEPHLQAGSQPRPRGYLRGLEDALAANYELGKADGIKSVLAEVDKLAKLHVSQQKSLTQQAERQAK
jgi:hypothetical protein